MLNALRHTIAYSYRQNGRRYVREWRPSFALASNVKIALLAMSAGDRVRLSWTRTGTGDNGLPRYALDLSIDGPGTSIGRRIWRNGGTPSRLVCQAWLTSWGLMVEKPLPRNPAVWINWGGEGMGPAGELKALMPYLMTWLAADMDFEGGVAYFFDFQSYRCAVGVSHCGQFADDDYSVQYFACEVSHCDQELYDLPDWIIERLVDIGQWVRALRFGHRASLIAAQNDPDKIGAARGYATASGWDDEDRERLAARQRELLAPAVPVEDIAAGRRAAHQVIVRDAGAKRWIGSNGWSTRRDEAMRFDSVASAKVYLAGHPELTLDVSHICEDAPQLQEA